MIKSKTAIYVAWRNMNSRCSPSHPQRANYYDKGIRVSEDWQSFANFKRDMIDVPPGLTLERKDNSLGYSKENCVWATVEDQLLNRSPRTIIRAGLVGVRYVESRKNWLVHIQGKYLGTRGSLLEAAALRKSAENKIV